MNKLLKDAIADAKAVRETALAQAKLALESAFAPKLQAMYSNKIMQEMGDQDDPNNPNNTDGMNPNTDEASLRMQELAGLYEADPEEGGDEDLEGGDEEFDDMGDEEMGDMEGEEDNKVTLGGTEYEITPVGGEEGDMEDMEDMGDMEDMEGEDEELAELLRQLEEESNDPDSNDPDTEGVYMEEKDPKDDESMEEEINLDELIQALREGDDEEYSKADDQAMDTSKGDHGDVLDERKKMKKMEEELNEAYSAVKFLREKLSEVNLLNAKLLYVNKLFRKNGLSESQKVKIIETFDRAKNVRETKLIYATLCESFNSPVVKTKKKAVVENFASAPVKKTQVINEGTDQMKRFKQLAGIIKS